MRTLIVTVAGTATRFNRDTEKEVLKCLYYKERPEYTLLYQILAKSDGIDEYIVVGGYLYDQLEVFVEHNLLPFKSKIKLVYNPRYRDYGSGYSLVKGLEAVSEKTDEIIFAEGDLFFDRKSFATVVNTPQNILTINREFIMSNKAVALYTDEYDSIHYLYDSRHKLLFIPEAFKAVYNSAQIWKFISPELLKDDVNNLTNKQMCGTNLEIIQGYFGNLSCGQYEIIPMKIWCNCNTITDYENIYKMLKDENIK